MNPFAKKAAAAPSESEVTTAVRSAVAENVVAETILDGPVPEVMEPDDEGDRISGAAKLSKLIDDDFPFDESQLDAIDGITTEQYACLTGAAGTGKTTTTKKIVDTLLRSSQFSSVNMETYWKSDYKDADDDYEAPESFVPSVVMCAFTGRATQMVKKNFPHDWHGNIMTIHRMLGYMPEWFEDWDDESGDYKKKMRFVPSYNADFKMPWDHIIIDEAGMLGVDLWHEIFAAMKKGCRVTMIGDINQLPPVHGRSVFGYAMCQWPAWELTHVHRQQGVNNPIVDNAWRILHGRMPQSEGKFQMIPLQGDAAMASRKVRAMLTHPEKSLRALGIYDPIRDCVITPINGEEGSRGAQLGQLPLNRELALMFNPQSEHQRFIIDGGRERKQFAVGDKVMATKNDWDTGITNGMTGVITDIQANGAYSGDNRLFGPVDEVNAYLNETDDNADHVAFSLTDLDDSMSMIDQGNEQKKESRDRGPSSHIVTVRFGDDKNGIEIPFQSLSEVGSLMTAYVVTCHKMQGGEAPTVIIICHDAHRSMLYREWLYTAVTRASQRCILLYSEVALKSALNKQKMQGSTLKQKVLAFNALQESGALVKEVKLPWSESTRNKILEREDEEVLTPARLTTEAEKKGGLMSLINKKKAEEPKPEPEVTHKVTVEHKIKITEHRVITTPPPIPTERRQTVDGGDVTPQRKTPPEAEGETPTLLTPPVPQLTKKPTFEEVYGREPTREESMEFMVYGKSALAEHRAVQPSVKLVSQMGATQVKIALDQVSEWSRFLLTHQSTPEPVAPAAPVRKLRFGVK